MWNFLKSHAVKFQKLKCKGDYCKNHSPDVVQCYNKGSDGIDVQVIHLLL